MKKSLFLLSLVLLLLVNNKLLSQNNQCCNFSDTGQYPGIASETFGVALGDIDNDGDNDAVIVDAYDDMEVYLNDGSGSFTYDQSYGSSVSWFGVYLVDVDMDLDLDIIVSGFSSGVGCEVWKNDGTGTFSLWQGSIASSIGMQELAIGDVNGDSYPDILAPAYSGSGSQVWYNDGNGTFTNSGQTLTGSSCTEAVLTDFDGDGDLDAFFSRTNGSPNTVWMNNGGGVFTDSGQSLGSAFSNGVDASDVDGDGDVDVVVANWQVASQVWLNDGNGTFSSGFQIQNGNYAKSVVMSDVDYDCDQDALIGSYGSNGVQVWTNDGSGVFTLCYENSSSNTVYAHDLAVADLNNDYMADIWVGNFSSSEGDHIFLQASPTILYDTLTLCPGDSVFVGCAWQHGEGDFLEAINCDTLSWYHIREINIDTSVTQNGDTLFALPNYDSYQWLECETMTPVAGANTYSLVSLQSGYFAVEITNQGCVDTSYCHWIQTPTANFEGTPIAGNAPLLVTFTDLSVDSVTTWQWDFGDGNTSTEQNPSNEYTTSGYFSVTLIITGPGGSDTLVKPDYIYVNFLSPTADFSGTPTTGTSPLEVSFTDLSTDSVNTWLWEFGDEGISVSQFPVYTYYAAGTYTVSLTVTGPGGSDMMVKTDYITVSADAPIADFSGTPTAGDAPLDVTFTDLSSGDINSWQWDFGDGDSSTLQSPTYTYDTAGIFTVSLTVTGSGGSDVMVKTDYITVSADAPVADFVGTPTTGEAPLLVSFTDLSTGSIDTWNWNFGDGDSSLIQNPTHEYDVPGNYTVSLTAEGYGGSSTEVKVDYVLIPVGIGEKNAAAIVIYPNPVKNKLHIFFPDATKRTLMVRSLDGKQLFEKTSSNKEDFISLSSFKQGVYLLIIKIDNTIISVTRVLKE